MKRSFFYKKLKSFKSTTVLALKEFVNIFLFPISMVFLSAILISCQDGFDVTLDTGHLSESCRSKVVANEFIVKFKHESTYRTITASDSRAFFDEVVQPLEDDIEQYGLNFRFSHDNLHSRHEIQAANQKLSIKPWVKTLSRSDFLYHHGYYGQGVKVAVLDTGIDVNSPILTSLISRSKDSEDGKPLGYNFADGNEDIQDYNGHGTMVSALIAAPQAQTLTGEIFEGGLAPQAELLPIKIFPSNQRVTDLTTILKGLDYAIKNNVDIINASWGGSENCSILLESKLFEVWSQSILFITSAGDKSKNLSLTPDFPASFNIPTMVVVSGINRNLEIPGRANFGGLVNLFAPSQDVPTLGLNHELIVESGTSLASAIATGGAALLKSAFPESSLQTLSYALTHGSSVENPTAQMNILDLKSSYFYMTSQSILPDSAPAISITHPR